MLRYLWVFDVRGVGAADRADEWYRTVHMPEVARSRGPWLTRYESYCARAPIDDPRAYNYRATEMWFREVEPMPGQQDFTWYDGHESEWGIDDGVRYARNATGHSRRPRAALVDALPAHVSRAPDRGSDGPAARLLVLVSGVDLLAATALLEAGDGVVRAAWHEAASVGDDELDAANLHPDDWRGVAEIHGSLGACWAVGTRLLDHPGADGVAIATDPSPDLVFRDVVTVGRTR